MNIVLFLKLSINVGTKMTYSTLGVLSFSVSFVIEIESCDDKENQENLTLCFGSSYPGNHHLVFRGLKSAVKMKDL